MNELPTQYLTKQQTLQKYPFLTENMLKNILFKDIGGFRGKVVRKFGRRNLFDEEALLRFLSNGTEDPSQRISNPPNIQGETISQSTENVPQNVGIGRNT